MTQKETSLMCHKKSVKRISSIAPGKPNIPTIAAVTIFKPIWKFQIPPIIFIINISIPPNIELPINFITAFSGIEKILPIIKRKNIQAK